MLAASAVVLSRSIWTALAPLSGVYQVIRAVPPLEPQGRFHPVALLTRLTLSLLPSARRPEDVWMYRDAGELVQSNSTKSGGFGCMTPAGSPLLPPANPW